MLGIRFRGVFMGSVEKYKIVKLATLFSGIGAPEQAAKRVFEKVETIFACEWDKYARESYIANYNIDKNLFFEDIRDLDAKRFNGAVDILVGGSPCQDFSTAGKGAGFDGFRGSLTWEFVRVIDEVKPRVFIFENVPGIKSYKFKQGLEAFIARLREIGYYLHIENADTKNYGIPQSRNRFFIVGFLDVEVYKNFSYAPKIKLEKRLKDILEDSVDSKYYLSQKMLDGYKAHKDRHTSVGNGFGFKPKRNEEIAFCIKTKEGNRQTDNYIIEPLDKVVSIGNANPSGIGMNGEMIIQYGVCSCLTTNKGEGIKVAGKLNIRGNEQIKRVYADNGCSPCLTTMRGGVARTQDYPKGLP